MKMRGAHYFKFSKQVHRQKGARMQPIQQGRHADCIKLDLQAPWTSEQLNNYYASFTTPAPLIVKWWPK
jgi:hypothetical protein